MKIPVKILIVEHDPSDIEFLQRELKQSDLYYETEIVSNPDEVESAMLRYQPDIILSDYNLPSFSGMDVFRVREQVLPYTPFIFVSGAIGEENAIECIKSGVTDYVLKDKLYALPVKIKRALSEAGMKRQKINAEKELLQSEMNLSAIFNNTDTGFLLLDTSYDIVSFNNKLNDFARILFGFELSVSQNLITLTHSNRKKEYAELLDAIIEGNNIRFETHYYNADGEILWFSVVGKPVNDADGKVVKVCLAINDITEVKAATLKLDSMVKELTSKNNDLHKLNIELDKFVYSTSHDLRAPLLSLFGLIEMCADYKKQPEHLDNLFSMMTTSVNRVDETIKSILFYSRNARTEIQPELINIYEIVSQQIQDLKLIKQNRKISFTLNIERDVDFYSDRLRITSIISNLLSNAVKYQRGNEDAPVVKFTFTVSDNDANIIVEDNGEGIPKKAQGKIFDMFVRSSLQSTGSGLGLYICREMAEKLGGNIRVVSEIDKGSKFIVKIPNLIPLNKNVHESSFIH